MPESYLCRPDYGDPIPRAPSGLQARSSRKSPPSPGKIALTYTPAEYVTIALGALLLALAAALGYRAWKSSRITPEELERRRRAELVAQGKMGDALLVEFRDGYLFYSYAVRGVEYTASQDVSLLRDRLPGDLSVVGPVSVKYDARNPANSIVVAEAWSGLRG